MNEITEQFNKLIDFGFKVEEEDEIFSFFLYDYKGLNFSFFYTPRYENKSFWFYGDLYFNPSVEELDEMEWLDLDADRVIQIIENFVPTGKTLHTYKVNFSFSSFDNLKDATDRVNIPLRHLGLKDLEIKEVKKND